MLDDISEVGQDVVSAITASPIRTNSCVVTKLVKDLIAQGPLIVLFKKSDAMTQLESRIKDIQIPFEGWSMETTDYYYVVFLHCIENDTSVRVKAISKVISKTIFNKTVKEVHPSTIKY